MGWEGSYTTQVDLVVLAAQTRADCLESRTQANTDPYSDLLHAPNNVFKLLVEWWQRTTSNYFPPTTAPSRNVADIVCRRDVRTVQSLE